MEISQIVCTHGFSKIAEEHKETIHEFIESTIKLLRLPYWEANFIVGDPLANEIKFEDKGRTCRLPVNAPKTKWELSIDGPVQFPKLYAKLDGASNTKEEWEKEGHPEYPLLTFLLADEY